jgi:hypothetical protein
VDETNYSDFVSISALNKTEVSPTCRRIDEHRFKLLAPPNGYIPGNTYKIVLTNAKFTNAELDSTEPFFFTIIRQANNVVLQENVKKLEKEIRRKSWLYST